MNIINFGRFCHKMQIHRKNTSTLIDRLILAFGFVLLIFASSISHIRSEPFCHGEVDLVFVIDASYSIKDPNFDIVCNFVIQLYSVILQNGGGNGNLHAGVVMYASTVYTDLDIPLAGESNQLVSKLKKVERDKRNTNTNTYEALVAMFDMVKTFGRQNSTKLMILITDGVSNEPAKTKQIAQTIKQDPLDIFMIAIGIGSKDNVDISELRGIASNNAHALIQDDLESEIFVEEILKKVCAETLDKKKDPVVVKESLPMDVVFMIPENVLNEDFQISKDFIKAILQRFEISNAYTRLGVIKYGEDVLPTHLVQLSEADTEIKLNAALDAMTRNVFNGGGNAITKALERLNAWRNQLSDTDRPLAAVLLTSKMASQPTLAIQQADLLKLEMANKPKVYLLVLGIGTDTGAWASERSQMAYSDAMIFHTNNSLGIAGSTNSSRKLIEQIATTLSRIGKGSSDTTGPVERWNEEFDGLFMLDGSNLVTSASYQVTLIKFVIKELIDEFVLYTPASPAGGRVGVVLYDSVGIYNEIPLGSYTDRVDLLNQIDNLEFISRTPTADNAIAMAAMTGYFNPLREPAAQLAYIITMSRSGYPILVRAEAHKQAENGVQVMPIGINNGVSQAELNSTQLFDGGKNLAFYSPVLSLASPVSLERLKDDLRTYAALDRPGVVFRWNQAFDFIALVHDASGRDREGIDVKYFLKDILSRYDIGPDNVRVGIIPFGKNVNTSINNDIKLGENSYLGSLTAQLFLLSLTPTGGPNVEDAFVAMRAMFDRFGRPGVPNVVLLITQGINIPDSLDTRITEAKNAGIKITTIGIGAETSHLFMQRIASNPDLAFQQPSWPAIQWTTKMDAGLAALAMGQFPPEAPTNILRLPTQCGQRAAIIFLIDTSESIASQLPNIKAFVSALISGFEMERVQIGFIGFAGSIVDDSVILPSASTYIERYLQFNDQMQLSTDGLSTNTDLAIDYMTNVFQNIDASFEKICVLVTDGKSSDSKKTIESAEVARTAGIHLIAIGVGQHVQNELIDITGNADLYFGFTDVDITDAVKLQNVQEKICTLARPGDCGSGSFRDSQFICQNCSLGTFQMEEEQLFCQTCPADTTTFSTGTQEIDDCKRDCPPGTKVNGQTCEDCPVGKYQDESAQTDCKDCPLDRNQTPFPGASSSDQCTANICPIDMDLLFIVDGTSSISIQQLALMKAFIIRLLPKFTISLTNTRVGLVLIKSVTGLEDVYGLSKSDSESAVIQAVLALQGGASSTNTASALSMATKEFDENGRPGVPKVMVLMSDGISSQPGQTSYEALLAREKGHIIFSIGLGDNLYEAELRDIAPGKVFIERDFTRLPTLDITPEICDAANNYVEPTPPQNVECSTPIDVIIIMDLSDSAKGSLVFLKAALIQFLRVFESSADTFTHVQIGVFGYDENIHDETRLTADMNTVRNGILNAFPNEVLGTNTPKALDKAAELLNEGRQNVKNVVMIFTDGISNSQDETIKAAARLREKNIYTIAVSYSMTNPYITGLKAIGTAGSDSVLIFDTMALGSLFTDRMKAEVCIDSFVCSFKLDIVFIWDPIEPNSTFSDKIAKFTADISKRFSSLNAFVIKVGSESTPTIVKAIEDADRILSSDGTAFQIKNILIMTDKNLPTDVTSLTDAALVVKRKGIRVIVLNAGQSLKVNWAKIASSHIHVFPSNYLDDLHLAWFICKEPCDSGYEVKEDGLCDKCEKGFYRNHEDSYQCKQCDGTTTTVVAGSKLSSDCIISICEIPIDLVLLIDASDSIGTTNFGLLKAALWNLIDQFKVGLSDELSRVAYVKIGQMVKEGDFARLTDSTDATTVKTGIVRLAGGEPHTNTADAIGKMTSLFREDVRPDIPKICVVITDGKSENTFQTIRKSVLAKKEGITMIAVAVGENIYMEEINAIASSPGEVLKFSSFYKLFDYKMLYLDICEAAKDYKPDVTPTPDPLSGDCSTRTDLVFVFDAGRDISDDDFDRKKAFAINMIDRLDIGLTKIRVGVVSYSNQVHTEEVFPLNSSLNKLSVREGIWSQKKKNAQRRNTVMALGDVITMFQTATEREGVSRVVIVIESGQTGSLSGLESRAEEAKNEGIQVIAIGYDDTSDAMKYELETIATDPDLAIHLNSLSDLKLSDVLQLVCAADFQCLVSMEIYMIWDLSGIDSITRAEKFIEILKKDFTQTTINSVFIDHVDSVVEGVTEGLNLLLNSVQTQSARTILIISDKLLSDDIKDQLQIEANRAMAAGIQVVIVDAHVSSNGLDQVASHIKLSHRSDMFDVLPHTALIKQSLCTAPCNSGSVLSITTGGSTCVDCPKDMYRDATESFGCTACPSGEMTSGSGSTSKQDCLVGKCKSSMDLVYVIDASQSLSYIEFNSLLRAFLVNTLSKYDIGLHRIALVLYSSSVFQTQVFDLNACVDKDALLTAVRSMTQEDRGSGTNTAAAFDTARFILASQGRQDAFKSIVLFSDGISDNPFRTMEAAGKALKIFIRVIGVAIGKDAYEPEIKRISSKDSYRIINTFTSLVLTNDFVDFTCEDTYQCDKDMDILIFYDQATLSLFRTRVMNFEQKLKLSYGNEKIKSFEYFDDLESKIDSEALSRFLSYPEKTKVFLFIVMKDIDQESTKMKIKSLRERGGVVALINANLDLNNKNFVDIVSNSGLLFKEVHFNDDFYARHIERQLCIDPCTDGNERGMDGTCAECAVGFRRIAIDSSLCISCPEGQTTMGEGSVQLVTCILDCGPGTFNDGSRCIDCEVGEYQPEKFQSSCIACPQSLTTVTSGSKFLTDCIVKCIPGTRRSTDGKSCIDCPLNFYQPDEHQTACIECPVNLKTDSVRSTSLADCQGDCSIKMDVIFLVDGSTSVGIAQFQLIKAFIINTITKFVVSQNDTRFGIMVFANNLIENPMLELKDSVSREAATDLAFSLIQGADAGTNMLAALNAARDMFNSQGKVDRPWRVILITDGIADQMDPTEQAAKELKKSFVYITCVGVGPNAFLPLLRRVATNPDEVISVSNFIGLATRNILPNICGTETCDHPMDVYLLNQLGNDQQLQNRVLSFKTEMESKFPNSNVATVDSLTLPPNIELTNPGSTKSLVIITNQPNTASMTTISEIKARGFIVSVIYVSDNNPDTSYEPVVSDTDLLFFAANFHQSPYSEYIFRALCIAPCRLGKERNSEGLCSDCERGTYREGNDHVCVNCADGETTNNVGATSIAECVNCMPNNWLCGDMSCIPLDLYCNGVDNCADKSDEQCNNCGLGEYWDGTNCAPCAKGTFQDELLQTSCKPCLAGTSTPGTGTTTSAECSIRCDKNGEELNEAGTGCTPCKKGFYRNINSHLVCNKCPNGYTTKEVGSTSEQDCVGNCPEGQALIDNQCELCPPDFYQPEKYQTSCLKCPEGTASVAGSTNCTDPCPAGQEYLYGPTTQVSILGSCQDCSENRFATTEMTTCQLCPTGYITLGTGKTDSSDCLPNCPPGSYFNMLLLACSLCERGEYQPNSYQLACISCPPGKATEGTGSIKETDCKVPCFLGEEVILSTGVCRPCDLGYYKENPSDVSCTRCVDGWTTPSTGSDSSEDCIPICQPGTLRIGKLCVPCVQGTFSTETGQDKCTPCPAGLTTPSTGADRADLCQDLCPIGSQLTSRVPFICTLCPKDFYRRKNFDNMCVPCDQPFITLSEGAESKQECLPDCKAGESLNTDSVLKQCTKCIKGWFQPLPNQLSCVQCPEGRTTDGDGKTSITDCLFDCPPGQYWDLTSFTCKDCGFVSYQPNPYQSSCIACPPGTSTTTPTAIRESQCKDPCPKGEELQDGLYLRADCVSCTFNFYKDASLDTKCQPCPAGLVTDTVGSSDLSQCKRPCTIGFRRAAETCLPCGIGEYQDQPNQDECKSCPPDQTTDWLQSISLDNCTDTECKSNQFTCTTVPLQCIQSSEVCDESQDCADGSDEGSDLCTQCPAGQKVIGDGCEPCPDGTYQGLTDQPSCINCSTDGFTAKTGATVESECFDCRPGTFYDGSQCEACPIGQYQDETNRRRCKQCPNGQITAQVGTSQQSDCIDCSAGTDFTEGDTQCRPCPVDFYRTDQEIQCTRCPAGFVTMGTGSIDCKPNCRPGFYYTNENVASSCTQCPWGSYQPEPVKDNCIPCEEGLTTVTTGADNIDLCLDICPGGTEYNRTTDNCVTCPQGFFKERGVDTTCQQCDNGFTTNPDTSRATSKEYCLPDCLEGSYYNSDRCELCDRGFYQNLKYQTACKRCPAGTFVPFQGSVSRFDCQDQCDNVDELLSDSQGSYVCRPCPKGKVKVAPQTVCTACPPGFTTTAPGSTFCVPDCPAGLYYNGQECLPCPQGTFQTLPYQVSCTLCDSGLYTRQTGSIDPLQCIDLCPNGTQLQFDGACVPCRKSYFRTKDEHKLCVTCPGSFFTRTEGAVSMEECLSICLAGSSMNFGETSCTLCPEGQFQDRDFQRECIDCGAGQTTLDSTRTRMVTGATSRSQCSADCREGQMMMGTNQCISCPRGTYQDQKYQDTCKPCPLGTFTVAEESDDLSDCNDLCENGWSFNVLTESCKPCGFNRYKNRNDSPLCKDCPIDFITTTDTATECVRNACGPDEIDDGQTCVKIDCGPGTFVNPNNGSCIDCIAGTFQDLRNQRTCKQCVRGTTSNVQSKSQTDCNDPCPIGSELPPNGRTSGDCVTCRQGWYKLVGESTVCVQCLNGFTTLSTGSTNSGDCMFPCKAGSKINANRDGCEVCDLATYQPDDLQTDCIPCLEGLSTDFTGSTKNEDCKDICNSGFKLHSDKKSCMECPKGKYRQKDVDAMCVACGPGLTTETIASPSFDRCIRDCMEGQGYNGTTGQCEPCAIGFYQPVPYNENCIPCLSWKTTLGTGAVDLAECIDPCRDGTFRNTATGSCELCPQGTYRAQNIDGTCQDCGPLFSTLSQGATSKGDCVPLCPPATHYSRGAQACVSCEPNTFNPIPYQFECKICPQDFPINEKDFLDCRKKCLPGETWNRERKACNWCEKGFYRPSTSAACIKCPGDRTTLVAGSHALSDCIPNCESGQFWIEASGTCNPCVAGTIQAATQPHGETTCMSCSETTNQPLTGQALCQACPAGQRSTDARTSCKSMCSAGMFWNVDVNACRPCLQHFYQETAGFQESCVPCPDGKHTLNMGSTSQTDCQTNWCGPGLTHVGGQCVPCGFGSYKGVSDSSCQACLFGQTTFSDMATSITECTSCTRGERLDRPTSNCLECPMNTYQSAVMHILETCIQCATGLHTISTGSTSINDCSANWCPAGQTHTNGMCVACGIGFYRALTDATCQACPTGTTTTTTTATSLTACVRQEQDWCGPGREMRNGRCCNCLRGFYKPANSVSQACTACPLGTTTSFVRSTSMSACLDPCKDGFQFMNGKGCVPCGIGRFKTREVSPLCMLCPPGTTTGKLAAFSVLKCCIPECTKCVDIIILVDNSMTAGETEITLLKTFLKQLTSNFRINQNDVRIGITRYGTTITQVISLSAGISREAICQAIDNNIVVSSETGANTGLALNNAREMLTTLGRARKRVLLITDEVPTNAPEALMRANEIKALNATITVIGMNDPSITSLANNHFTIQDYRTLHELPLPLVVQTLC